MILKYNLSSYKQCALNSVLLFELCEFSYVLNLLVRVAELGEHGGIDECLG